MPLLSQRIPHLLNGVSQLPAVQRAITQVTSAVNSLATLARGTAKRPPLLHIGKLTSTTTGWDAAYVHDFNRDDDDRFRIVIVDGAIRAFDALTGTELSVIDNTPDAMAYLSDPAGAGFRAVSVGDNTIVVNRGQMVRRSSTKSAAQTPFALVTVEQADFSTTYFIRLQGITVSYTTVDQATAASRGQITTDNIAEELKNAIEANLALNLAFNVERFGSTLFIETAFLQKIDFDIAVFDGLGDQGLRLVKDEVESFEDLPGKAKHLVKVKVAGDAAKDTDDYWVQFVATDGLDGAGVWRETIAPKVTYGFDKTTMPHRLVYKGSVVESGLARSALPANPTVGLDGVLHKLTLTFPTGSTYPVGTKVDLTIDGESFSYQVTGSAQSQDTVANGVKLLVDASATFTATVSANVVSVTRGDSADPALTAIATYLPSTIFYSTSLALTVNEYVGYTIRNVSDGSEGTITANTADTITATLSGGADNSFAEGDVIEVYGTSRYFVFEQVPYDNRGAGDDTTVPFPSFTDSEIDEVFFHQARLGFLSGEYAVLSKSGDVFDFFRASAIDLLDDDPIDVRSAHSEIARFHSAVTWAGDLWLWAENGQYIMSGDPFLSPKTVRLDLEARFYNNPSVRPLVLGSRLYFTHQQDGHVRLFELIPASDTEPVARQVDLTRDVPAYMDGKAVSTVGDAGLGLLFILPDGGSQDKVFCLSWAEDQSGQRLHAAWQRWDIAGVDRVLALSMIDGKLGILSKNTDGVYLGDIDTDTDIGGLPFTYVDRRIDETDFISIVNLAASGSNIVYTGGYGAHGNAAVDFERYDSLSNLPDSDTWQAAGGKFGTGGLRIGYNAFGRESLRKKILRTSASVGSAAMYVQPIDTSASDQEFFRIFMDTTLRFTLRTDTAGPVILEDFDGSTLATGSTSLTATYRHIEVRWRLSGTSSGYVKVWVDGNLEIDYSGAVGNASTWNSWGARGSSAFLRYFKLSDVVVRDSEGVQLGNGHRLWTVLPDSDAGTNQWTPSSGTNHAALVDDPDPDQGLTYLTSPSAGAREEFGFTLPAITGTIASVVVHALGDSDGGTDDGLKLGMKLGANETLSAEIEPFIIVGGTLYEDYRFSVPTKPGGGAWTVADLANAKIIMEAVSGNMRTTQVWLEILTVGSSDEGGTVITLPYEVPTSTPVVVIDAATGDEFGTSRPTATDVQVPGEDLTASSLHVGIGYEMRVRLSPIYLRDARSGEAETRGRLQLRYLDVEYHDTNRLDVEVTPLGRTKYTKSVTAAAGTLEDGMVRVPIQTRAEEAVIELVCADNFEARIGGLDWEGFYNTRSRRI